MNAGLFVPGHMVENRNYWLFPMVVENKDLFIQYMIQKGVVTVKSSTQLKEVKPHDEAHKHAPMTRWLMDNVIYLPVHKGVPEKELKEQITRMCDGYAALKKYGEQVGAKSREGALDTKFRLTSKL